MHVLLKENGGLGYLVGWVMTVLQDASAFLNLKPGAHASPNAAARARSAAPGTRKAAQKPSAEASSPPPIGPRAKPVDVAEEATPKAAPCRSGGAACFMARLATGMAQPRNRLVARRNAQSSGTLVTRAWGIAASPASARAPTITRRVPNRLASLPPSKEAQGRHQRPGANDPTRLGGNLARGARQGMDETRKGDGGARDRHVDREQDEKTREQQPVGEARAMRAGAFFPLRFFGLVSM
jgi:hypothetical protein